VLQTSKKLTTLSRKLANWFRHDLFGLVREIRFSYLPPLMVYFAAGVSGFTGIVESFYVKQELGLSAAFLAGLGFWVGLPWALKMPVGHLVDIFWRYKSFFVYVGALIMAVSLLIMVGLTGYRNEMARILAPETWYVIASLLSPIGFVLQDAVADAMTVEAVPTHSPQGDRIIETERNRMHITMQTLGRIAIIGGSAVVAGVGGWLANTLSYRVMYEIALLIPVISVAGVILGQINIRRRRTHMRRGGMSESDIRAISEENKADLAPNVTILGGSAVFVLISLALGLSDFALKKETIFAGSLAVIALLMHQLLKNMTPSKRREIVGIAIIVFVFRAMPSIGAGASWWQIDVLGFDEAFFGTLRQIASKTITTKANVATALQMVSWGVEVNDYGNAISDESGVFKKVRGEGVTEEVWERMVALADANGWSGGNYKNLNLPVDNWLMAQPDEVRQRMVDRVEGFVHKMLVDVFNAEDTAPLAIELLIEAGSHDIGAEAERIEDPQEWSREKIIERAQKLDVDKGPEGDFDD